MTYLEIIEEFKKQPPAIRTYMIYELMKQKSISFIDVSKSYVSYLENQKEEDLSIKAELAACLLMETNYQRDPRKDKWVKKELISLVHRTLAILDKVDCFQLDSLKERYSYNEELGKSQGNFWRGE